MRNILIFGIVLFIFFACGSKELTNEEKIAGTTEKIWKATHESNAAGDKDKLNREEKKERITFSKNGNVIMGNGEKSMSGQWSLDGTNLKLHFAGENVTENFVVLELKEDLMKLKAGDGSELTMKPD